MKRDFDTVIFQLDGNPVKLAKSADEVKIVPDSGEPEEPENLTIGNAITQALLMGKADGTNAKENITRYHLAKKVYDGGVQEVKSEEIELAKKAVGQIFGPLVVGQVADWCDKDYEPKSE